MHTYIHVLTHMYTYSNNLMMNSKVLVKSYVSYHNYLAKNVVLILVHAQVSLLPWLILCRYIRTCAARFNIHMYYYNTRQEHFINL